MRNRTLAALMLFLVAAGVRAAEDGAPRVNVVVDAVRGVRASDAQAALLVLVVDEAGDPVDDVVVTVLCQGKPVESGSTDARGRLLLRLKGAAVVSVRAEDEGVVTSVANGVDVGLGGLTAVVLPLEEVVRAK